MSMSSSKARSNSVTSQSKCSRSGSSGGSLTVKNQMRSLNSQPQIQPQIVLSVPGDQTTNSSFGIKQENSSEFLWSLLKMKWLVAINSHFIHQLE